jgi:fluoride ion exporter CrcB/FEX
VNGIVGGATGWACVLLLGGVGSVLRFLVDKAVSARAGRAFPYGTLVVNISGAVVLGFLSGQAPHRTHERRRRGARRGAGTWWRSFPALSRKSC